MDFWFDSDKLVLLTMMVKNETLYICPILKQIWVWGSHRKSALPPDIASGDIQFSFVENKAMNDRKPWVSSSRVFSIFPLESGKARGKQWGQMQTKPKLCPDKVNQLK